MRGETARCTTLWLGENLYLVNAWYSVACLEWCWWITVFGSDPHGHEFCEFGFETFTAKEAKI